MKNVIRIIAVIQIILAVAFGFYANKIDTGVAKISRKFAASCGKTAEIIASHKIIYEKSATNIVNLQNVLDGAGDKTRVTADKFQKWGSWLQNPPEGRVIKMLWPGKTASSLGFSMGEMSSHLNDVSAALHNQAQILKEYEEKVLPRPEKVSMTRRMPCAKQKSFWKTLSRIPETMCGWFPFSPESFSC